MDVLFDLDGTLTDPALGITRCLSHALTTLGHESPDARSLRQFIGPPLTESFAVLMRDADPVRLAEALQLYRRRFVEIGMFENMVYPDVPDGLADLVADGHRLWVATSKPRVYARQILEHFSLAGHFAGIYGAELSGEYSDKASLIRLLMTEARLAAVATCMVGDRSHDVVGAKRNGIAAIGVLWGFGSASELSEAGADLVAGSMAEVREAVARLG